MEVGSRKTGKLAKKVKKMQIFEKKACKDTDVQYNNISESLFFFLYDRVSRRVEARLYVCYIMI